MSELIALIVAFLKSEEGQALIKALIKAIMDAFNKSKRRSLAAGLRKAAKGEDPAIAEGLRAIAQKITG